MTTKSSISEAYWQPRPLTGVAARRRLWAGRVKRIVDVVLACGLLIVLVPVMLLAAFLICCTSRGPVIFVQQRVGYRCSRFGMFKLRTMVQGAEELESKLACGLGNRTFFKLPDDPRITGLGRLLRQYSIDEVPQLLNVLRGDMSLVGPRPLLPRDYDKMPKDRQLRRFSMKPGLTGLWQVSGRSLLTDGDRMRLDLEYVDRWSPWLDLEILVRTVPAVVTGRGAA